MAMIPNDEGHILSLRERSWSTLSLTRRELFSRANVEDRDKKRRKTKDLDEDVGLE